MKPTDHHPRLATATQATTGGLQQPLSRRQLLKQAAALSSVLGTPALLSACGQDSAPAAAGTVDTPPDPIIEIDPMDPNRLHGWVTELCAYQPRWRGYPAEAEAGRWLANRLQAAGLSTRIEPYPITKWQLDDWRVSLTLGDHTEMINSFPIWSTPGGQGTAELVDVGFGSEPELLAQDLRGKAVVVTGRALLNVFATYPDSYHRAAELGAVAMFVSSDAPDNLIRPTSSSRNDQADNPMPAFQLGAHDLARFKQAAHNGGTATWSLDAYHLQGESRDVIAELPGSGALPGTLLICAHYDAWFSGALDNATGVSGLIGLAEHFASLPLQERPRDMIFLGVTGHDAGYPHGGVTRWTQAYAERLPDLDLFVNLDHLAAKGEEHFSTTGIIDMLGLVVERPGDEERALFTTAHPALARTFAPYLLQYGLMAAPVPTVPTVNANGDLEGLMGEAGVPCVNLTMATPHYHTVEDTPDRVPPEQLARAVMAHRDFITDILPMTREQIRSPI
ncbi:MAG: M28 family peptidase [Pseudomonadota bacterium]|nr:M28 family peptidase [Pseudomonadota bacterium]